MMFVGAMVVITLGALRYKKPFSEWPSYFSTDDGKGILKGILLAVGGVATIAVLLTVLTGCSGKYMNDATAYAGLDHTMSQSPQCVVNDTDDRFTSNLGLKLNLFESNDAKFRVNSKYTHHSCAFGGDRNSYDAAGVELEYKMWSR